VSGRHRWAQLKVGTAHPEHGLGQRESRVEVTYKGTKVRELKPAVRIRRGLTRGPAIKEIHTDAQQGRRSVGTQRVYEPFGYRLRTVARGVA
jgi:hypothetical protein